ncbi:MAG TPA: alpha/beta hydrolase [Burkholderiales bacterium]|nr:alpha/beta hydrolase [Burkholderiales bacterium]
MQPSPAPHASRYIEANGLKLRYLDYGTGGRPPMFCLHGGAVNAHWFDFVAGAFTADYHVRALDQRGHGDSQWTDPPQYGYQLYASDFAAIAEQLDLRDIVLVGHSMGGTVSIVYTAEHQERVKALIVVDSTLKPNVERVNLLRGVGSREGRSYASHEEFVANFKMRPPGTQAVPQVIRYLAERGGRQGPDGRWRPKFDRNVYAQRQLFDVRPLWNRIAVPVLIVKGGLSNRITPEIWEDIQVRCPHAKLVEVPGSEHHVTLDNPADFTRAVSDFLLAL